MGFLTYLYSFDVCCLTETFTSSDFDFSIYFSDYNIVHSPGIKLSLHGRRSGGVVILVKKSLELNTTFLDTNIDTVLALRLHGPNIKETILMCVYVPPQESPYYKGKNFTSCITVLDDLVLTFQERYPQASVVMCGDLNARIGAWDLHTDISESFEDTDSNEQTCVCAEFSSPRVSQDKKWNVFGNLLKNFCIVHHAAILNGCANSDKTGRFTFISPQGDSVIDYCIVVADHLHFHIDMCVGNRVESHHMPIEVVLGRPPPRVVDNKPSKSIVKLIWDEKKIDEMRTQLESPHFTEQLSKANAAIDTSVDDAVDLCTQALSSSADCMKREIRVNNQGPKKPMAPWFDTECIESRNLTIDALRNFRKRRSPDSKEQYTTYRRKYKSLIREKKRNHFIDVRDNLMNNLHDSRVFWNTIKSSARRTTPRANISTGTWKCYFETMFQSFETSVCEEIASEESVTHDSLDARISKEEVIRSLSRLKASKAPGLDGLPGGCLKVAGEKIAPFLTKLFNKIYDTHSFPRSWSRSVILPLHKKGNVLNVDNYRGISLLCVMSKIFASILTSRLREWIELENKVCPEQAGFRTQHSTIDHIYTLHAMILKHVYGNRRGKLYVTFIDYRKAFDSVNRSQLWEVLRSARLSTKFLKMLQAMYHKVQSCVRWGQEFSDFFNCPSGVKQGAVESPSIFSLYINAVADHVRRNGKHGVQMVPGMTELYLLLFADDVVLVSTTPVGLQNQLDSLQHMSKLLNLTINTGKTKVMVFRRGGHLSAGESWFLDGSRLETVNHYRYLGFIFTTKLSIDTALDEIATRGKQKGVQVLKALWNLRCMKTKVFTKLFDAQVQATLLYGAEIWGLGRQEKIERTHTFMCKRFMGIDTRSPNHMVYGDLGRFPLTINSGLRTIKYWLKLCHMTAERLPKQAFLMLQNSSIKSGRNWAESVKLCLCRLGFYYAWLNSGVGDDKRFLSLLKQRLKDCCLQEWSAKNVSSDRYVWYSSFKQQCGLEEYLNLIDIKKFRDVLIRFRFGINDLNNNKRYIGVIDTNCPWCKERENEQHFLMRCPVYKHLRKRYLPHYLSKTSEEFACKQLMQCKSNAMTRSLAMYIFYAFRLREQKLKEENNVE